MRIYIGCSGYYYNHWKTLFYPEKLPKNKWLIFYSEHFNTVELNNTFYRMPDEKSVRNWYTITPPDFKFAVKGYRFLTHQKKLNVDSIFLETLTRFEQIASLLKEKTGPILWQFPANFNADLKKLDTFCSHLSTSFRHVFEFRNFTWYVPEVYEILQKRNHDLCIVSGPSSVPRVISTLTHVAYIRFHGEGSWYNHNYSNESLINWKNQINLTGADTLYAYFNNDMNAFAISNAKYFSTLF
ncbi:MAG TPA: DUF72 domain-containing protein [Bacteroidales bacterium]|nr:DUF72 domain-containing protein [Bacteroidales bacterium]